MKRVRQAITVEEAIQKVIQASPLGSIENIDLEDCYRRVLGETIQAHEPVPYFRRSAMDGYAISAMDSKGASQERPRQLQVIERIAAGDVPSHPVLPGMAARIMTGAKMPDEADAVIMQEKVKIIHRENSDWIQISEEVLPLRHVSSVGEDISVGDVIITAGSRIEEGDLALLASFGYDQVAVRRQPKVGIIASGAELVPLRSVVPPGKIRNSNSYMLMAQVKKYGGIAKLYGIIPDVKEEAKRTIKMALNEVDLLITSGGVSVGDFDLMPEIFEELGAELLFDRVAMRPGKPTTVAVLDGKMIFGLSGNPSACFVGFELFAKAALLSYQGYHVVETSPIRAEITSDLVNTSPFLTFIRGNLFVESGVLKVNPLHKNKASMMSSLNQTNCFLVIPAGNHHLNQNDGVDVLLFGPINNGHFL
jgi:molybdopterin molybdotransferase